MTKLEDIEKRVAVIESRNRRVEADKSWEISLTRRLTIALLTYGVVVVYLAAVDNKSPFINALVPAIGFFLSTLVLKGIKDIWQSKK